MTQPRGHPEADLQRAIVHALRIVLPFGAEVHASNNEVRGSSDWARKQQALNRSMGQRPGFPDLMIMVDRRVLFLEVKTPEGRLSTAQREFQAFALTQGHGFAVVRSVDDALAALREYNIKTRIAHG